MTVGTHNIDLEGSSVDGNVNTNVHLIVISKEQQKTVKHLLYNTFVKKSSYRISL